MSRTATRLLAAIALAGLTTLVSAPAFAAPPSPGCNPAPGQPAYPPAQCDDPAVSDSTATPGQTITVYSGEAQFDPGSAVSAELDGAQGLGTVTADEGGGATITFKVPDDTAAGTHSVVFTGPFFGVNRSVSVSFQVVAAAGGALPLTGFEVGAAALLGVGLLGGGTIAVISGRRRRLAPLAA